MNIFFLFSIFASRNLSTASVALPGEETFDFALMQLNVGDSTKSNLKKLYRSGYEVIDAVKSNDCHALKRTAKKVHLMNRSFLNKLADDMLKNNLSIKPEIKPMVMMGKEYAISYFDKAVEQLIEDRACEYTGISTEL